MLTPLRTACRASARRHRSGPISSRSMSGGPRGKSRCCCTIHCCTARPTRGGRLDADVDRLRSVRMRRVGSPYRCRRRLGATTRRSRAGDRHQGRHFGTSGAGGGPPVWNASVECSSGPRRAAVRHLARAQPGVEVALLRDTHSRGRTSDPDPGCHALGANAISIHEDAGAPAPGPSRQRGLPCTAVATERASGIRRRRPASRRGRHRLGRRDSPCISAEAPHARSGILSSTVMATPTTTTAARGKGNDRGDRLRMRQFGLGDPARPPHVRSHSKSSRTWAHDVHAMSRHVTKMNQGPVQRHEGPLRKSPAEPCPRFRIGCHDVRLPVRVGETTPRRQHDQPQCVHHEAPAAVVRGGVEVLPALGCRKRYAHTPYENVCVLNRKANIVPTLSLMSLMAWTAAPSPTPRVHTWMHVRR